MDVTPDKQNIDTLFANTTYHIDFYQRQYKWTELPVKRLLEDIFYKFNIEFEKMGESDIPLEKLVDKFSWYYLNTYVTNIIEGKKFIVDGQQRLTTLSLLLMKLRHLSEKFSSSLKDWITNKIAGQSGFTKEFWMNHEAHKLTLKAIFESDKALDQIDTSTGITAVNILKNYTVISDYLDKEITSLRKFETFVFYTLRRLVLINLNVEQTDVPMVFEVINDRGVRLKSYEILKGKLLGQIDKEELEVLKLNDLWENQVTLVNAHGEDEIERFFQYYLRSQFSDTVGAARNFDKDYHRVMFTGEYEKHLKLLHNAKRVKDFLQADFKYYSSLYVRLSSYTMHPDKDFIQVYYNGLNEMDSQFLLVLSACTLNDPEEDLKIQIIAYQVDRLFSLLQLQRSYDSNEYNVMIYQISAEIRKKAAADLPAVFNKYLLKALTETRGVQTAEPFTYSLFKETGIELSKRFKRYLFARVEEFIAAGTNLQMKHHIYDLVYNTGSVNGFHIEHILAENKENKALFGHDEEKFERERNRLGGLLLLKGKDNISSNNETYDQKLKSYANTLYWNETLREDSYKSKLDFGTMISKFKLNFRPMSVFGPNELEERHKLLFEMARHIWA